MLIFGELNSLQRLALVASVLNTGDDFLYGVESIGGGDKKTRNSTSSASGVQPGSGISATGILFS